MTGIFASIPVAGKPRCARCKRPFTPKSADQKYGHECARIIAAAGTGDARQALEGHTVIV